MKQAHEHHQVRERRDQARGATAIIINEAATAPTTAGSDIGGIHIGRVASVATETTRFREISRNRGRYGP
ncbi:MAG: hypothetical protein C0467_27935 [Planctomycetaceae bacterium]|nr:hypothetical protein [Planctomycetaceae bacterium]